ncbi:MAG TPA: cytochrome P450 [Solirubrobacteraceae bacterium]|jgi:cytochrome P450|nr:cytochrome P450 [Solirubrobacteraceae bacterium]
MATAASTAARTALRPPRLRHENPFRILIQDLADERAATVPYPPGDTGFSLARTKRFIDEPLPLLLEGYERYGPIFTLRILHSNVVFMLGPAANHYITVSHAANFTWRESHFRDLIALLGDGLLTTDDAYHKRSRQIMLPAFHRERIAASIGVMREETERALDQWRPGQRIDLYSWTRHLATRIAMRALFGIEPDGETARSIDAAALFEQALWFYASGYQYRFLRGPRTPWAQLQEASNKLDQMLYGEIARKRTTGERGEDVLSLLLDAQDESGEGMTDTQIRDEMMTLLFAGHDTTTSTVSFMFYELARHPHLLDALVAEQDAALHDGRPSAEQLLSGELAQLEMTLDETLRKYPPAWIGPRKSVQSFEFEGHTVPANAYVNYCSWASHHLSDVFAEPEAFRPERFSPDAKKEIPKGAYIPFGGGSRTCIGMRFGQLEVRTIATLIAQRYSLELPSDFALSYRQMPTISPREGLPMTVHARAAAAARDVPRAFAK